MENCLGCAERCGIIPTRLLDQRPTWIDSNEWTNSATESRCRCAPHTRAMESLRGITILAGGPRHRTFKDNLGSARSVLSRWNSFRRRLVLPEGFASLPTVHCQFSHEISFRCNCWNTAVAD